MSRWGHCGMRPRQIHNRQDYRREFILACTEQFDLGSISERFHDTNAQPWRSRGGYRSIARSCRSPPSPLARPNATTALNGHNAVAIAEANEEISLVRVHLSTNRDCGSARTGCGIRDRARD